MSWTWGSSTGSRSPGGDVVIDMTLTGRGCPMHGLIADMVRRKVAEIPGMGTVQVNVVWDPPWNPTMMSRDVQIRYGFATADEDPASPTTP